MITRIRAKTRPVRLVSSLGPSAWCIVLYVVLALVLRQDTNEGVIVNAAVFAIAAAGLDLAIGYGKLLILSAPLFMMVGALTYAELGEPGRLSGTTLTVVGALGGLLLTAVLSTIVGLVALRVSGLTLVLVTAFILFIGTSFVGATASLGGYIGISAVPSVSIGSFVAATPAQQAVVCIVCLAVVLLGYRLLVHSSYGAEVTAVGNQPEAAASIGIQVRRRQLEVFVLSSLAASLAGTLYAATVTFVASSSFSTLVMFDILLIVYAGGRRSIWGASLGALALYFGRAQWGDSARFGTLVEGAVFLLFLLALPNGIAGILRTGFQYLRHVLPSKHQRAADMASDDETVARELDSLTAKVHAQLTAADQARTACGNHQPPARPSGRQPGPDLVIVANGVVQYGGVRALDDITLSLQQNVITAIIGANGAGKTTLFNVIAGATTLTSGRVTFQGTDVTAVPAWRRARMGIARTFQVPRVFHELTVEDNVTVAARLVRHRSENTRGEIRPAERAEDSIRLLGLDPVRHLRPGELPLGVQRAVEIARALATAPSLVLLDEAASGLAADEKSELADTIRELARHVTVTLIEHDTRFVQSLADRVVVLGLGSVIADGDYATVSTSPTVIQSYLGTQSRVAGGSS
jgi:branched-chain amino acid transport system permease protein